MKFLNVGVSPASTPPDVPPLFLWKDAGGNSLAVMYLIPTAASVKVPGSDFAVDVEVTDDNLGPHTIDRIHGIFGIAKTVSQR